MDSVCGCVRQVEGFLNRAQGRWFRSDGVDIERRVPSGRVRTIAQEGMKPLRRGPPDNTKIKIKQNLLLNKHVYVDREEDLKKKEGFLYYLFSLYDVEDTLSMAQLHRLRPIFVRKWRHPFTAHSCPIINYVLLCVEICIVVWKVREWDWPLNPTTRCSLAKNWSKSLQGKVYRIIYLFYLWNSWEKKPFAIFLKWCPRPPSSEWIPYANRRRTGKYWTFCSRFEAFLFFF